MAAGKLTDSGMVSGTLTCITWSKTRFRCASATLQSMTPPTVCWEKAMPRMPCIAASMTIPQVPE